MTHLRPNPDNKFEHYERDHQGEILEAFKAKEEEEGQTEYNFT